MPVSTTPQMPVYATNSMSMSAMQMPESANCLPPQFPMSSTEQLPLPPLPNPEQLPLPPQPSTEPSGDG